MFSVAEAPRGQALEGCSRVYVGSLRIEGTAAEGISAQPAGYLEPLVFVKWAL